MDLQDFQRSYWNHCLCNQPQVDASVRHHPLEEHPDPHGNAWSDPETMRVEKRHGRSFALDARIRLDSLKSGCNSPSPCCGMNIKLYKYDSEKDLWDGEDSQTEQSALDLVEILDIEDNIQDEENWLYKPENKQSLAEKESALRWCRHVLDDPSPEMEAARRVLRNKLDQRSRYDFYSHADVYRPSSSVSVGSCRKETSVSTSLRDAETSDQELNVSHDSITTGYTLQDITDVHIMARIQEDSLRQEYVSTPAPFRRNTQMLQSYLNTKAENDAAPGNKTKARSSSSAPPSVSSSCCKSPKLAAQQSCQSPKLSRLHQQVTQFKLLRLAQNQGASPGRTPSPLRTSLRSLQAVRNSRSLEVDDYQPAGSTPSPSPGVPSPRTEVSGRGSPTLTASPPISNDSTSSTRGMSARITAMKRLQRSQSLSPSRIAHPSRGYLSAHGRVFACPERPSAAAWGRHVTSVQR